MILLVTFDYKVLYDSFVADMAKFYIKSAEVLLPKNFVKNVNRDFIQIKISFGNIKDKSNAEKYIKEIYINSTVFSI